MPVPRLVIMTALLLVSASAASGQTGAAAPATVQDVLGFLVTNQGVQTSDFDKDRAAADATRATLTRALLASIATLPISTSSSGFTYRFNATLGTVERASDTFGPFFVERALTAGAGQASVGFTFQYESFQSLDGHDLRSGEFVTTANRFTDETRPFDVEALTLNVTAKTATFFTNVGLTDRIDVGAAVPIVRLDLSGTRVNTYRGLATLQASAQAERFGLADIAVRSKVRFTPDGPGAIAGAVEVRLPTGREADLLGSGSLALRVLGLASYEAGPASIHGNLVIGRGGIGRELSYGGAVAVAANPRVTIVGEVMGRRIAGSQRVIVVSAPHPRIRGVETTRLTPAGEEQTTAFSVAGVKWNVGGTWLMNVHVLMPLSDHGLTANVTPTIALDYSFGR